ncbi:MAG: polysialyltransferase family glycosyltransferase [Armatimonadota bacterium]
MIRVCCTVGTWQLVTLAAALQQIGEDLSEASGGPDEVFEDYLVVYETSGVPDAFKETLQQMAEAIWPWKRIIWAYDLLTSNRNISQRQFDDLRQTLRERVGVPPEQVDEVWVCWLTRPAEKLVFETYPTARIQLFEDGLISYIPVPLSKRLKNDEEPPNLFYALRARLRNRLDSVWSVRRYRRGRRQMDPRHLRRIGSAYLQLTPDLPPPETLADIPRRFVDYRCLGEALDRVKPILPWADVTEAAECSGTPDRLLVLGQALSRNGIMSRSEEFGIYRDVVDAILAKGYSILWKEHPRISTPFFADLKVYARSRFPDADERLRQLSIPHAFPVELVADRLCLAGCAAGSSAALFYLKRLYGIPCYTFGAALAPRMKGFDLSMNDIIRRDVPPLDDLPSLLPAVAERSGQ